MICAPISTDVLKRGQEGFQPENDAADAASLYYGIYHLFYNFSCVLVWNIAFEQKIKYQRIVTSYIFQSFAKPRIIFGAYFFCFAISFTSLCIIVGRFFIRFVYYPGISINAEGAGHKVYKMESRWHAFVLKRMMAIVQYKAPHPSSCFFQPGVRSQPLQSLVVLVS